MSIERVPSAIEILEERIEGINARVSAQSVARLFLPHLLGSRMPSCEAFLQNIHAEVPEIIPYKKQAADMPVAASGDRAGYGHVIGVIEGVGERYIVDPTYSQFTAQYGVSHLAIQYGLTEDLLYPEEKVLVIPESRVEEAAEWVASCVRIFWQNHGYKSALQQAYGYAEAGDWGSAEPPHYFRQSSAADAKRFYTELWDLEAYARYQVPEPQKGC